MLIALALLPLQRSSGCPIGHHPACPYDLVMPDAMVGIIQLASGATIGLFTLCLVAAITFTVTRGWRRQRSLVLAAAVACAAFCLLIALKASEAYAPFAQFRAPAAGYSLFAVPEAVSNFSFTIVIFRDRLTYLVIIGAVLAVTIIVQAVHAAGEHRRTRAQGRVAILPSGG